MAKTTMIRAWEMYRAAGCNSRDEFRLALKEAWAEEKARQVKISISNKLDSEKGVTAESMQAYMQAAGMGFEDAVKSIGYEIASWDHGSAYVRNIRVQREAVQIIEKAIKDAAQKTVDKENGVVSGRWVKAEEGWMVRIEGKASEGGCVRIVKRNGECQLKSLVCEIPTEYGILWQVA